MSGSAVVRDQGASPYTLGFKVRRCRHLTEAALLGKVQGIIAELIPLAEESITAGRALEKYQDWRFLLAKGRGAGYTYIDSHYAEIRALTEATLAEQRAKRQPPELVVEERQHAPGETVYEGLELRDLLVQYFPDAYQVIDGKRVRCKADQEVLL